MPKAAKYARRPKAEKPKAPRASKKHKPASLAEQMAQHLDSQGRVRRAE